LFSFLAKKNNGLLGIDISSSSIKLLELSKSGSKYKVENYASRPLPDGAVVEKNIANLDAVGETMLKLSSLIETTTEKAAVAVSGSAVITKSIEMNGSMSDSEMETELLIFITPSIINEVM
jgi:type IV pilus assembly protein PilM